MQQCIRTSRTLDKNILPAFYSSSTLSTIPFRSQDKRTSTYFIFLVQFPTFSSSFPPKRDGFRSCAFSSSYRVFFFSLFLSLFSVIFCLSCCCAWFCCCFRTTWLFRRRCHFRWCGCDCCAFHSRFSTTRFICTVPVLNFLMNARIFGSQHRVVC